MSDQDDWDMTVDSDRLMYYLQDQAALADDTVKKTVQNIQLALMGAEVPDKPVETPAAKAAANHNYFPTEPALAYAILHQFMVDFGHMLPVIDRLRVLDAGCGGGAWGWALRRSSILGSAAWLTGVDIRTNPVDPANAGFYDLVRQYDYAQEQHDQGFDVAMGNPPYGRDAERFIRHDLQAVEDNQGFVIHLVRNSFLGSQGRNGGLFLDYPYCALYFIAERPSFTPDEHTEKGMEYVAIVQRAGYRVPEDGKRVVRTLWWRQYRPMFEVDYGQSDETSDASENYAGPAGDDPESTGRSNESGESPEFSGERYRE